MSVEQLRCISEPEGNLYPIEFSEIPFEVKRVFYVTNVDASEERGFHAHYKTQQILICIQGLIQVNLYDGTEKEYLLHPGQSVFVDKLVWDSQVYVTGNDILMSLCSTPYDPADYITDFKEYQDIIAIRKKLNANITRKADEKKM